MIKIYINKTTLLLKARVGNNKYRSPKRVPHTRVATALQSNVVGFLGAMRLLRNYKPFITRAGTWEPSDNLFIIIEGVLSWQGW